MPTLEPEVRARRTEQEPRNAQTGIPAAEPRWVLLRQWVGRPAGKLVLAVCPSGKKVCTNKHCLLQPLCACARAELRMVSRSEARVWLVIAACAALLIVIACIRMRFWS